MIAALSLAARRWWPSACRSRLNLGGEFMPKLNEGDLLIEAVRIPSASLEGAVPASTQIEKLLKTIPEVRLVYCKTGRPEIANDVMGVHQTDVWTMLKPQDEWRPGLTRDALIEEMDKLLTENVPGRQVRLQPADRDAGQRAGGRRQERRRRPHLRPRPRRARGSWRWRSSGCSRRSPAPTISRPRPPAGCRCCGSTSAATSSRGTASRPPTSSTPSPRSAGPPSARSSRRPEAAPAAGPPPRVVAERRREDRLDPDRRSRRGGRSRCKDLADIAVEEGPSEVERENVQRRAVVGVNVRGRDIASFVAEAQAAIDATGQAARPATCSAGAASSSTCRRPPSGC